MHTSTLDAARHFGLFGTTSASGLTVFSAEVRGSYLLALLPDATLVSRRCKSLGQPRRSGCHYRHLKQPIPSFRDGVWGPSGGFGIRLRCRKQTRRDPIRRSGCDSGPPQFRRSLASPDGTGSNQPTSPPRLGSRGWGFPSRSSR